MKIILASSALLFFTSQAGALTLDTTPTTDFVLPANAMTGDGTAAIESTSQDENANARTMATKLFTISNDRDTVARDLELVVDGQAAATGARYVVQGAATKTFSNAQIASGAVLEEQQGVQALVLSGRVDSGTGEGVWTLKFVANGLTGEYKSCNLKLQRSAQGAWEAVNAYTGAKIKNAKMITWSLGITTIQGVCR